MTWYANNLYMPATESVVTALESNEAIRPFLYVIKNLDGYLWHRVEMKHSVGPVGLAVVRPLASIARGADYWYKRHGDSVLDWTCLRLPGVEPPPTPPRTAYEEPPESLIQFLAELSSFTNERALYYAAVTFGGSMEYEAA